MTISVCPPELLALAQKIADMPPQVLTPAQIEEWAAKLAADVANAND